uniref:Cytochrome c oxidase subunit 3 n=1 Tax=Eustenogaster scitula TaxID=1980568 RepID=A0A510A210_9HYME|nr:cytochrome c oxidase subunit III [Eustenogaster scitula]ARO89843.1 cytochrome c oxidase subunit III [Eustenogaster scitula]
MNMMNNHPFHIVSVSPWPIIISFSLLFLPLNLLSFLNNMKFTKFLINILLILLIMFLWWRDVIRESTFMGFHTKNVYKLMKMGMILFILSEVMFFVSFFWTYFHMYLSPSIEIGSLSPPKSINMFNPYNIPLLNSIILISSGITITWSHSSILMNKYIDSLISLMITIFLGMYFSLMQLIEYLNASFSLSDSIYGSIFFMATGFHGFHVILGTLFLLNSLYRMLFLHFSQFHHFGFEASIWYWHFVDVVWLFLYICIYWWPY